MRRARTTMRAAFTVWVLTATACFDSEPPQAPQFGGETHFMRSCTESCAAPLECVCGVCTKPCSVADDCRALDGNARCAAVDEGADACGDREPERACAALCGADEDCDALGTGFTCTAGQCRLGEPADQPPVFEEAAAACAAGECGVAYRPLVMLLVDTSGSMEYKADCRCTSPGCTECLPDCASGERNRWVDVLEALGGRFEDYGCEQLERTAENGATFDEGYFLPYHRPFGTQGDDGLLDRYRDRLRFGAATFDGWDTYKGGTPLIEPESFDHFRSSGVDGLWSYNLERDFGYDRLLAADGSRIGHFRYPGCENDYLMDTGIRDMHAVDGPLTFAALPASLDDVLATNAAVQVNLRGTRPYGGTPIPAAFDDLYYLMAMDARMANERALSAPKFIVHISDGRPDSDYRDLNCDCGKRDQDDPFRCWPPIDRKGSEVPLQFQADLMHCPYPTAEEAARALRCGRGESCDGPVSAVHVVGYSSPDADVRTRLDVIAIAGSEQPARFADDATELRAQLEALFEEILAQQP